MTCLYIFDIGLVVAFVTQDHMLVIEGCPITKGFYGFLLDFYFMD